MVALASAEAAEGGWEETVPAVVMAASVLGVSGDDDGVVDVVTEGAGGFVGAAVLFLSFFNCRWRVVVSKYLPPCIPHSASLPPPSTPYSCDKHGKPPPQSLAGYRSLRHERGYAGYQGRAPLVLRSVACGCKAAIS